MTFKYNNVYINETSTITGPYEKNGPLGKMFDKCYKEFYFGTKTWEQAEAKLVSDSVELLLKKSGKNKKEIDLHISGDLLNQLVATNYASINLGIPLIGVYGACSTSCLGMALAANMVSANQIKNSIVSVSSHNNGAEKQFRQPVEYGGPKPKTATFTTTGSASCLISSNKSNIKIDSATIGSVVDLGITDAFHMGAVMAPAAAKTLYDHLNSTNRTVDYYDLILTGDLGRYGKDILKDYMKNEYSINLINYDDSACIIYDLDKQDVYAGGSGPACLPLVTFSYIFDKMKRKELKKVLIIATGALMSQSMVNQKLSIPAIAHAISLEANI